MLHKKDMGGKKSYASVTIHVLKKSKCCEHSSFWIELATLSSAWRNFQSTVLPFGVVSKYSFLYKKNCYCPKKEPVFHIRHARWCVVIYRSWKLVVARVTRWLLIWELSSPRAFKQFEGCYKNVNVWQYSFFEAQKWLAASDYIYFIFFICWRWIAAILEITRRQQTEKGRGGRPCFWEILEP